MPSQSHSTLDSGHSTPPSDDEVLVRVEGVSKKFCRSLKKSLWYGVCDIAGELLPGRKRRETRGEGRELSDRSAQDISRSPLDAGLSTAAAASSGSAKALDARPSTFDSSSPAQALDSGPSTLDSTHGLRAGEFFAVKDVSFELRRHQCLGLIGHNGAGNQAAGQPLGPRQPGGCTGDCRKAARRVRRVGTSESTLPLAARRVRRRGKARINTTLLKMLNGLIKPDAGSITMRGRLGALIALGAGFNPILTGRENIYINGSVLGLTKMELQ